jgi:hypothetical protein
MGLFQPAYGRDCRSQGIRAEYKPATSRRMFRIRGYYRYNTYDWQAVVAAQLSRFNGESHGLAWPPFFWGLIGNRRITEPDYRQSCLSNMRRQAIPCREHALRISSATRSHIETLCVIILQRQCSGPTSAEVASTIQATLTSILITGSIPTPRRLRSSKSRPRGDDQTSTQHGLRHIVLRRMRPQGYRQCIDASRETAAMQCGRSGPDRIK